MTQEQKQKRDETFTYVSFSDSAGSCIETIDLPEEYTDAALEDDTILHEHVLMERRSHDCAMTVEDAQDAAWHVLEETLDLKKIALDRGKAVAVGEYLASWPEDMTPQEAFDTLYDADEMPDDFIAWEHHHDTSRDNYPEFIHNMESLCNSVEEAITAFWEAARFGQMEKKESDQ